MYPSEPKNLSFSVTKIVIDWELITNLVSDAGVSSDAVVI
jgi:hypothetical protein